MNASRAHRAGWITLAAGAIAAGCAWVAGVDVDYRVAGDAAGGAGTGAVGAAGADCDADVDNDVDHCGQCDRACPVRANSVPKCEKGQCLLQCNDGYDDCDDQEQTGCEAPVTTDLDHCGGCDQPCGDVCEQGECRPTVLYEEDGFPWEVVVDDVHVYWTAINQGDVMRCEKVACAATAGVVTAGTAHDAGSLTLHESYLYWAQYDANRLLRCPVSGCAIAEEIANPDLPIALSVAQGQVYFTNPAGVWRVVADGTAPPELLFAGGAPRGIAHDGSRLFWSDFAADKLLACDPASCSATVSDVITAANAWQIKYDATHLFWADVDHIAMAAKDGSGQQTLASGLTLPRVLPFGDRVFFSSGERSGFVASVPKQGGVILELADQLEQVVGLAADEDAVYFTQAGPTGAGTVSRIAY